MPRLEPGNPAPSWTLTDHRGKQVSLSDYAGRHLIMFFYPAAMTPGCTTEACDFRDSVEALQAAGYEVVGISPDSPEKLARFAAQESLPYPLLSDPDKQVLQGYGAYGEKSSYGRTVVGVIRSTIVVDPRGAITLARYNVKATGHVAMLRRLLAV
ncbi:putative peroxiredoxin [Austwickia sp. TVS 96-490-7B]|uniref:thioredoxin-dependent thiol peroxidase n=1 Tax=Austwickia sp. TVS 96-490-7B TaxID=2830843 RepID=UPI001C56A4EF|nr:thioredoxin-dependent thiol peroxidase [Austwickia sp. TVS 96-490-7B]MBW3086547.1 putative peroxiredoxin [Austwickia sp. TVS 96-490-7B]